MASKSNKPDQAPLLKGKLLIADPSLRDGVFDRSVILLLDHTREAGALGLILNHPMGKQVGELTKDDSCAPLRTISVHHGGPVAQDQMTFSSFWWSKKLGLRWATRISADQAHAHTHKPGRLVRAFVGYSGWSPGQLEKELKESTWIPTDVNPSLLGSTHDRSLWHRVLDSLSPIHRILARTPDDPFLN